MVSALRVRGGSLFALSVLVLVIGGRAGAAPVFSTFGPGDSYDTSGYILHSVIPGWENQDLDQGDRFIFSGTQSYTLDSIELALDYTQYPGTGPTNVVDVWLMTDVGVPGFPPGFHQPGDVIEAFSLNVARMSQGIKVGNSVLHPVLNPDTNYWLIASIANGFTGWLMSSPVVTGWHTWRWDLGAWSISTPFDDATLGAFRINGTPVGAAPAVPVPGESCWA